MGELSELEARILAFEREREQRGGSREAAIRAEFGVSPARYYQMLYAVLDSPPALRHDPVLVHRLQRLRERRRAARSALRPPADPSRVGAEPQD